MSTITPLEIILSTFSFAAITFLGLAVYLKNPHSWTNRLFIILSGILDAYVVVNVLSLHPPEPTPESQLFWIRVVMFFAALMSPVLFLLVHTFPKDRIRLSELFLAGLLLFTIFNAAMALTPLVFESISYPEGEAVPAIGEGMPAYFLHFVGFVILSFSVLLYRFFNGSGLERIQQFYLLWGVLATFLLMTISTIVFVVIFKTSAGVFLGPIFPVILMSSIAYAIAKYRFLDIRPVIARSVSDLLLIFIVFVAYFSFLFVASSFVTGALPGREALLTGVIFAVVITATFQPLKILVRRLTDHLFFKGMYNPEKLLSDLTHILATNLDLNDLTKSLLDKLVKEMRIAKAAFLVDGHRFPKLVKGSGYKNSEIYAPSQLETDFNFLNKVQPTVHHVFVLNELPEEQMKDFFRKYDMEVLVPIKVSGEIVASLILGSKASGELYSLQDLKLLDVFASESGIAIQNARLYAELRFASEAKSRFINVVSHQLRTPVSGMRWSIEALKQKKLSQKERQSFLDHIYDKALFLGEQLDNILTALEIYDKKMFLRKTKFSLPDFYQELLSRNMPIIKNKKLGVEAEISREASVVKCDNEKIEKVVRILFENAISYANAGSTIFLKACLDGHDDKKSFYFSVQNEGMGFSKADEQHIFEEFYRSDDAKLYSPNGLGLGLFIAKAIVEAHKGVIKIQSPGKSKGATAYFTLPLA